MRKNNNNTDKKKLLGQRIKELRKRNNLTLAELGEKIGIEPSSLGNIENGYNYPLLNNLEALANALNCNIRDFFLFEHLDNEQNLISEINKMLQNHPDKISDIYKMLKGLFS